MLVKQGNQMDYNYKEYYLDNEEELNAIDTRFACPGSVAYIIDTSKKYMLNNNKEWKVQSSSGSGDGGASSIDSIIKEFPYEMLTRYTSDPTKYGTDIEVTNKDDITIFEELFNEINEKETPIVRINMAGILIYAILGYYKGELEIITLREITSLGSNDVLLNITISRRNEKYYVNPHVYTLS